VSFSPWGSCGDRPPCRGGVGLLWGFGRPGMEYQAPQRLELMTNFRVTQRHRGGLPAQGNSAPNDADSARTTISYPWPTDAYRSSSSLSAVAPQNASGGLAVQAYGSHEGAVCKTVGYYARGIRRRMCSNPASATKLRGRLSNKRRPLACSCARAPLGSRLVGPVGRVRLTLVLDPGNQQAPDDEVGEGVRNFAVGLYILLHGERPSA
jgi:hypothetical protein